MKPLVHWASKAAMIGAVFLYASAANASTPWEGEFHSPLKVHGGKTVYWVFKTTCKADDDCKISSGRMSDGKYLPPTKYEPRTKPSVLKADPQMAKMLRLSVKILTESSEPVSGPDFYNAAIYPQIESPDRVLECRTAKEEGVAICRLDQPLVDVGDGVRSEWVLLTADMSSASGCPGSGSVCPAVLLKK